MEPGLSKRLSNRSSLLADGLTYVIGNSCLGTDSAADGTAFAESSEMGAQGLLARRLVYSNKGRYIRED